MEATQVPVGATILLYDGICGLCTKSVQFVLRHDAKKKFYFASLQGAFAKKILGTHGKNIESLDTVCLLKNYGQPNQLVLAKSEAFLEICEMLGGWFQGVTLLGFFPHRLLDRVYDWVANSRYAWFGQTDQCLVAERIIRERFIEDHGNFEGVTTI